MLGFRLSILMFQHLILAYKFPSPKTIKYNYNMKLNVMLATALLAMASSSISNAASYYVNNVITGGASDVLIEDSLDNLLDGGIVAIGYFTGGSPSSSLSEIGTTISNFNLLHSVLAGSYSEDLGDSLPGYFQSSVLGGASILAGNPLIGQAVYLFAGNQATLAASTEWGIVEVGTFVEEDSLFPVQYTANTSSALTPANIIIGSVDSSGANQTFQLAAVPEPSTVLLCTIGALALLRRRRI